MSILGYTYVFTHKELCDDYEDYTSTSEVVSYKTLKATFNAIKHILKNTGAFEYTTFKVEIDSEIEKYEGKEYNKWIARVGDVFSSEIIIIRTVVAKEDPGDISDDEYLIEDDSDDDSEEEVED